MGREKPLDLRVKLVLLERSAENRLDTCGATTGKDGPGGPLCYPFSGGCPWRGDPPGLLRLENRMVKCECCEKEVNTTRIFRLSLNEGAEEKRVCQPCFCYLMDASRTIRASSGEMAFELASAKEWHLHFGPEVWSFFAQPVEAE